MRQRVWWHIFVVPGNFVEAVTEFLSEKREKRDLKAVGYK